MESGKVCGAVQFQNTCDSDKLGPTFWLWRTQSRSCCDSCSTACAAPAPVTHAATARDARRSGARGHVPKAPVGETTAGHGLASSCRTTGSPQNRNAYVG